MILCQIDIWTLWNQAWPAGLTMLALGLGFAIILLFASHKLKVEPDEKLEQVLGALPNANCGACGFAGCSQYAKAVLKDPKLLGRCSPGGNAAANTIAKILGIASVSTGFPKKPIVHCNAHTADKTFNGKYTGLKSCTSANAISHVQACTFGCLGMGDCVSVCKFFAMFIESGLATIDYDRCTGCGACAQACPRNIIKMVEFTHKKMMTVACSSRENGKNTRTVCRAGCIGCGLCAKNCEVFSVKDNLAKVDHSTYKKTEQAITAMVKCPTKVIIEAGTALPVEPEITAAQKLNV